MSWNKIKLGAILTESKNESDKSDPDKRITVRLNLKGVEKRAYEPGIEGATKYFIRKAGQFIYGKQNLFKGAFGIIPKELDEFESSSDIPAFDVNSSCLPEWLFYYLKQGDFYLSLESIATGTGSRRIQPARLFEVEIPLPSIKEQKTIVAKCTLIEKNYDKLIKEIKVQKTYLQQIRQAILQEAVQGKLTKQNKDDEPASKLLQRIKSEKQKLIAAGKLKKEKELPPITKEEMPFELPIGWLWVRGENVASFIDPQPSHRTPPKVLNGIPYIGMSEVREDKTIDFANARMVSNEILKEHQKRYTLEEGDFIFGKIGTIGEPTFLPKPFNYTLSANIILIQPFRKFIDSLFISYYLQSPDVMDLLKSQSTNSTHLVFGIKKSRMLLFPLPPLSEQRRIVAKVQELLQLITHLEQQVAKSQTQAQELLQAVLKEAFNSPTTASEKAGGKAKEYRINEELTMAAECK